MAARVASTEQGREAERTMLLLRLRLRRLLLLLLLLLLLPPRPPSECLGGGGCDSAWLCVEMRKAVLLQRRPHAWCRGPTRGQRRAIIVRSAKGFGLFAGYGTCASLRTSTVDGESVRWREIW